MPQLVGPDQSRRVWPCDVLHHDERHLDAVPRLLRAVLAGVVDGHDRRVVQPGHGLGLAAEPGLQHRVAGQVGAQQLDGHRAAQPDVAGQCDVGHAAAPDEFADLVAASQNARRVHWLSSFHQTDRDPLMAWLPYRVRSSAQPLPPVFQSGWVPLSPVPGRWRPRS